MSVILCQLLLIVSCYILVRDVFHIRNYLIRRGAKDYINTSILVRHALAFGFVLVFTIAGSLLSVYSIFAKGTLSSKFMGAIQFASTVAICVSDLLLASIFWYLGTKVTVNPSIVDVVAAEWDEDAEGQAYIWNAFIRRDVEGSERFLAKTGSSLSSSLNTKSSKQALI